MAAAAAAAKIAAFLCKAHETQTGPTSSINCLPQLLLSLHACQEKAPLIHMRSTACSLHSKTGLPTRTCCRANKPIPTLHAESQALPTPKYQLKPKQRHSCAPSRSSSEMTAGSRGFSLLSTELVGVQGAYKLFQDLARSCLQEEN